MRFRIFQASLRIRLRGTTPSRSSTGLWQAAPIRSCRRRSGTPCAHSKASESGTSRNCSAVSGSASPAQHRNPRRANGADGPSDGTQKEEKYKMTITSDRVREIFKGLENGDGAAFFEHVADNVDWTVMGTHPLAGHYPSKRAFVRYFQQTRQSASEG